MNSPLIIIMMGPPGSGKSLQAKKLAVVTGYLYLSTGEMLRELLANHAAPDEERAAAERIKQGELAPDWLIYRLVFKKMSEAVERGQGVILDGAIRTLNQAEEFGRFFDEHKWWSQAKVVWLALSREQAKERLGRRLVCEKCGQIFSQGTVGDKCPNCHAPLITRVDDRAEVWQKRWLEQGTEAQQPVLDFFRSRQMVVAVDSAPAPEEVHKNILKVLE